MRSIHQADGMSAQKWRQFVLEVGQRWQLSNHALLSASNEDEVTFVLSEFSGASPRRVEKDVQALLEDFQERVRLAA